MYSKMHSCHSQKMFQDSKKIFMSEKCLYGFFLNAHDLSKNTNDGKNTQDFFKKDYHNFRKMPPKFNILQEF